MHIWGLFDDGNGCYRQAVDEYNVNMGGQHTIISIGIGNACINQDLAINTLHQPNALWEQLDKLDPKHGLLLYNHYILGNSIKYIAREVLHYELKYTYTLRDDALNEFDKLNHEKKG